MASLLIRNLDDKIKAALKARAEDNGTSMEAEARALLSEALRPKNALEAWRAAEPEGWEGIEFELPPRDDDRPLPEFD